MALSIIEQLQDIQPDTLFKESQGNISSIPQNVISKNLGGMTENNEKGGKNLALGTGELSSISENFTSETTELGDTTNTFGVAPFSSEEVTDQIDQNLSSARLLNKDTLLQAIPENPAGDTFNKSATDINSSISSLTTGLTGDSNFGKMGDLKSPSEADKKDNPFADNLQELFNNASNLPSQLLDILITTFKKVFDQLSDPDRLLDQLGKEALTDLFVAQIQQVNLQIPSSSIDYITKQIETRTLTYNHATQLLQELTPNTLKTLDRTKITTYRQRVKSLINELDDSSESIDTAIKALDNFNFQSLYDTLSNFPAGGNTEAIPFISDFVTEVNTFLDGLKGRIESVVETLTNLIDKITNIIEEAKRKVKEIGDKVMSAIAGKITQTQEAIIKVQAYVEKVLQTVKEYIETACGKIDDFLTPVKKTFNQISETVVGKINQVADSIETKTKELNVKLQEVKIQIQSKLSKEEIQAKIEQILEQVTGILEGETVQNAISTAEKGVNTVIEALNKVSLEPVFATTVGKTKGLETKFRTMDVSKYSTAKKAALKVGVMVLKQVDVPGTVNPRLQTTFNSILDPVIGLGESLKTEINKVDQKIEAFRPGTLIGDFLGTYLNQVVQELQQYKPSTLLQPIRDLYEGLLKKMDVLDPKQIIDKVDELYQKLLDLVNQLSPDKLTAFLDEKLTAIIALLDKIPIQEVVNSAISAMGNLQTLFAGLGLDSIFKSGFWQTFMDIINYDLSQPRNAINSLKQKLADRINLVDDLKLSVEIDRLNQNIKTFANNPQDSVKQSQGKFNTVWTHYTTAKTNFETQWKTTYSILTEFICPDYLTVDYQDLIKRLETIDNKVKEQISANQTTSWITLENTNKKVVAYKLPTQGNVSFSDISINSSATLKKFKEIIPNEIYIILFKPLLDVLDKIDSILAVPRNKKVAEKIKTLLETLIKAPNELIELLKGYTAQFGKLLTDALNTLKTSLTSTKDTLIATVKSVWSTILQKLEDLRPFIILNSFYDLSDFKNSKPLNLLNKFKEEDKTTFAFWTGLEANEKTLLESVKLEELGEQKSFYKALNRLLLATEFYNYSNFQTSGMKSKLPVEAVQLLGKGKREVKDTVRLNRLLLETAYETELVMSLESIFPFFKKTLARLYPEQLVKSLDEIYFAILKVIEDLPKAIENALNNQYEKVLTVYRKIKTIINSFFNKLLARLEGLKGELGIGLEDLGDAYNRLLNAIPV